MESQTKKVSNNTSYVLCALGVTLLIAGIYLSTYTAVEPAQAYKEIGLFVTLIAAISIGLAFTQLKKGRLLETLNKSD